MIARTWHGVTQVSKADEYLDYLKRTGVAEYKKTEGNRGVYVLQRVMETRLTSFCSRFGNQKRLLRGSQVQRLRKPNIIPKTRSSCLSLSQTSRTMRFWSNHSSARLVSVSCSCYFE